MKNFDRQYLVWALSYAVAGTALGIYMVSRKIMGSSSLTPIFCWLGS